MTPNSNTKISLVTCPICNKKKKYEFHLEFIREHCISGTIPHIFPIGFVCDHKIIAFVDRNGAIRSYMKPIYSVFNPPDIFNFSSIKQKRQILNSSTSEFFELNHIIFMKLVFAFYNYTPILILYSNEIELIKMHRTMTLLNQLNPIFFEKYVFIVKLSFFKEFSEAITDLDKYFVLSLEKNLITHDPTSALFDINPFLDLGLSLNNENEIKILTQFWVLTDKINECLPLKKIKFSHFHKQFYWLSETLLTLIIDRTQFIARNIINHWNNAYDIFTSESFRMYCNRQQNFDILMQQKSEEFEKKLLLAKSIF